MKPNFAHSTLYLPKMAGELGTVGGAVRVWAKEGR